MARVTVRHRPHIHPDPGEERTSPATRSTYLHMVHTYAQTFIKSSHPPSLITFTSMFSFHAAQDPSFCLPLGFVQPCPPSHICRRRVSPHPKMSSHANMPTCRLTHPSQFGDESSSTLLHTPFSGIRFVLISHPIIALSGTPVRTSERHALPQLTGATVVPRYSTLSQFALLPPGH